MYQRQAVTSGTGLLMMTPGMRTGSKNFINNYRRPEMCLSHSRAPFTTQIQNISALLGSSIDWGTLIVIHLCRVFFLNGDPANGPCRYHSYSGPSDRNQLPVPIGQVCLSPWLPSRASPTLLALTIPLNSCFDFWYFSQAFLGGQEFAGLSGHYHKVAADTRLV